MPRAEFGMGLISINTLHRAAIISFSEYIDSATDTITKDVLNHKKNKTTNNINSRVRTKLPQARIYSRR